MFAVTDIVWQALIGAVVTLALAAMQLWAKRSADRAAASASIAASHAAVAVRAVATSAAEVKASLEVSNAEQKAATAATAAKIADVAEKVEAVHKATNSLTDRLIESTDKEAHARGIEDERKRAGDEQRPP